MNEIRVFKNLKKYYRQTDTTKKKHRETNYRGPSNYCTDGPLGRAAQ